MQYIHSSIILQGDACLVGIRCFDEDELVFPHFIQNSHIVPRRNDRFHVQITREESRNAIRDDFAVFDKYGSKVPDNRRVISDFEPGTDCYLVTAACDDLEEKVLITVSKM